MTHCPNELAQFNVIIVCHHSVPVGTAQAMVFWLSSFLITWGNLFSLLSFFTPVGMQQHWELVPTNSTDSPACWSSPCAPRGAMSLFLSAMRFSPPPTKHTHWGHSREKTTVHARNILKHEMSKQERLKYVNPPPVSAISTGASTKNKASKRLCLSYRKAAIILSHALPDIVTISWSVRCFTTVTSTACSIVHAVFLPTFLLPGKISRVIRATHSLLQGYWLL